MSQENIVKNICLAIAQDDVKTVSALLPQLEDGIDTTLPDTGDTLMHIAAASNSLKVAIYLHMKDDSLLSTSNDDGDDPCDIAEKNKHAKFNDTVVEQASLFDDLSDAVGEDNDLTKAKLLFADALFDIDTQDADNDTLMHFASYRGNTHVMEWLLEQGADIHLRNNDGNTPLHDAASKDEIHAVRLLLNNGARALSLNNKGNTPWQLSDSQGAMVLLRQAEEAENVIPWARMGDDSVTHVSASFASGHKLTDIFNFSAREKITIVQKLASENETIFPPKSFDDLPEQHLRSALAAFKQLGGKADDNYVLHSRSRLNKPARLPDTPAN